MMDGAPTFPPEWTVAQTSLRSHLSRHLQGRRARSNKITFIAQSRIFI